MVSYRIEAFFQVLLSLTHTEFYSTEIYNLNNIVFTSCLCQIFNSTSTCAFAVLGPRSQKALTIVQFLRKNECAAKAAQKLPEWWGNWLTSGSPYSRHHPARAAFSRSSTYSVVHQYSERPGNGLRFAYWTPRSCHFTFRRDPSGTSRGRS